MSTEPLRLPPFPNTLMVLERRRAALGWLIDQRYPEDRARQFWARWCRVMQTRAERDEYHALELVAPTLEE